MSRDEISRKKAGSTDCRSEIAEKVRKVLNTVEDWED